MIKGFEKVDRDWKDDGGIVLTGDGAESLEVAKLHGMRSRGFVTGQLSGCCLQELGRLELSLRPAGGRGVSVSHKLPERDDSCDCGGGSGVE